MNTGNRRFTQRFHRRTGGKAGRDHRPLQGKAGGLIPVLEEAQVTLDYLPISIRKGSLRAECAAGAGLRRRHLLFLFHDEAARQAHDPGLPGGTACYVRGGKTIAESLVKEFNVTEGETTPDRRFTYETWSAAWGPAAWRPSSSWTITSTAGSRRRR